MSSMIIIHVVNNIEWQSYRAFNVSCTEHMYERNPSVSCAFMVVCIERLYV